MQKMKDQARTLPYRNPLSSKHEDEEHENIGSLDYNMASLAQCLEVLAVASSILHIFKTDAEGA